jgi:hypothetical protein
MGIKKVKEVAPKAAAANDLTFQKHPLLQIRDEDPECAGDLLEILLRPDSVRITTICCSENGWRSHSLHITPADFEAFVECGRAHCFDVRTPDDKPPEPWTFRENPLLQFLGETLDRDHYVEILLRPDGVSFSMSARDHEGIPREQIVYISPANFKAIIERCRTHRFGI